MLILCVYMCIYNPALAVDLDFCSSGNHLVLLSEFYTTLQNVVMMLHTASTPVKGKVKQVPQMNMKSLGFSWVCLWKCLCSETSSFQDDTMLFFLHSSWFLPQLRRKEIHCSQTPWITKKTHLWAVRKIKELEHLYSYLEADTVAHPQGKSCLLKSFFPLNVQSMQGESNQRAKYYLWC